MCCLFGLIDPQQRLTGKQKTRLLHALATAAEARGTDASGIAFNAGTHLVIRKAPIPGHRLKTRVRDDTQVIMGHTRMTTQGDAKYTRNDHPFRGSTPAGGFALAHNGVLYNDRQLREALHLPDTNIETDSYIAVQLIERKKALDLSTLKYMAEQVEGSFSFTVLDGENTLYIVKGDSPLYILRWLSLGVYIYASTEDILRAALRMASFSLRGAAKINVVSGEILRIDRHGCLARGEFDDVGTYRRYYSPYSFDLWWPTPKPSRASHVDELKAVAYAYGYTPEMIDRLIALGHTPEEIEEYLYEI